MAISQILTSHQPPPRLRIKPSHEMHRAFKDPSVRSGQSSEPEPELERVKSLCLNVHPNIQLEMMSVQLHNQVFSKEKN